MTDRTQLTIHYRGTSTLVTGESTPIFEGAHLRVVDTTYAPGRGVPAVLIKTAEAKPGGDIIQYVSSGEFGGMPAKCFRHDPATSSVTIETSATCPAPLVWPPALSPKELRALDRAAARETASHDGDGLLSLGERLAKRPAFARLLQVVAALYQEDPALGAAMARQETGFDRTIHNPEYGRVCPQLGYPINDPTKTPEEQAAAMAQCRGDARTKQYGSRGLYHYFKDVGAKGWGAVWERYAKQPRAMQIWNYAHDAETEGAATPLPSPGKSPLADTLVFFESMTSLRERYPALGTRGDLEAMTTMRIVHNAGRFSPAWAKRCVRDGASLAPKVDDCRKFQAFYQDAAAYFASLRTTVQE